MKAENAFTNVCRCRVNKSQAVTRESWLIQIWWCVTRWPMVSRPTAIAALRCASVAALHWIRDVREREWLSCTHSFPFPWLRSHSRPWEILRLYSNSHLFTRSNPNSFPCPFPLKQEEFKKTLIVVHEEELFYKKNTKLFTIIAR